MRVAGLLDCLSICILCCASGEVWVGLSSEGCPWPVTALFPAEREAGVVDDIFSQRASARPKTVTRNSRRSLRPGTRWRLMAAHVCASSELSAQAGSLGRSTLLYLCALCSICGSTLVGCRPLRFA
ncbi:hypothetical protein CALVIDRAFT_30183 [Calocera viscosa TUFC12733]|uniref:Secreted protein n=1 Tax=Calocera viscosa (strain TUFC12733) TaxID=1330018 RepID=A0A167PCM3_CALVF|nr:hypothetical protein CALVIDRAFT_30183 [Calocera viscosa TUFC12733]